MVDIFHDTLFFIIDTFYSIYIFGFLKLFTKTSIMPTHVFVLTPVAVEFHTTIRNIRYHRTLNTKVNTHDVSFGSICRFNCFVYDLGNYFVALINNAHGSKFTVCKDRLLLIRHLGFNRKPFRLAVYHDGEFNIITIDFEILIVDVAACFFEYGQRGCYRDVFALFGKLVVLAVSITTSFIVFLNYRLCITDALIC